MDIRTRIAGFIGPMVIGGCIGCVFMNILWKFGPFMIVSEHKLALSLLEQDTVYRVFWKNGMAVLGICIYLCSLCAGFSSIGKSLSYGFCFVIGIWWGALLTEGILAKGIQFVFFLGKLMFPECIWFLIAYGLILLWVHYMENIVYSKRKHIGKGMIRYWKWMALSVVFFLVWNFHLFYFWRFL